MSEIDHLLDRGESESLDFKRDQYRFTHASDNEKSELLKDILAMANAWRDGPAFILLGFDAPVGGQVNVVGITNSLDDAVVQQFVNAKTNRPITFNYWEKQFSGQLIGVVEIPVQNRPIYVKNDFGGVKAEKVYIRRGSSTAIALPDEIARMGSKSLGDANFRVEFADIEKRSIIGDVVEIKCIAANVAEDDDVPDYNPGRSTYFVTTLEQPNTNYYRDLIQCAKQRFLLREIGITVTNRGNLGAHAVRAEFIVTDPNRTWEFCMKEDFPRNFPSKEKSFSMKGLRGINAHRVPVCDIEYSNGAWHISFDFRDLQPKRTLQPGVSLYVGCRKTETLKLKGRIFADELPHGGTCELTIAASTKQLNTELDTLLTKFAR